MNSARLPAFCAAALATMSAAGVSHWWTVRQFSAAVAAGLPVTAPAPPRPVVPAPPAAPTALPQPPALAEAHPTERPTTETRQKEKDFYEALIAKMNSLQNQNRDLLDQVAETNRDLMKLEFRVDTHSEQFRPLPVTEDRQDTSFENSFNVLPPRAEPVVPAPHQ